MGYEEKKPERPLDRVNAAELEAMKREAEGGFVNLLQCDQRVRAAAGERYVKLAEEVYWFRFYTGDGDFLI